MFVKNCDNCKTSIVNFTALKFDIMTFLSGTNLNSVYFYPTLCHCPQIQHFHSKKQLASWTDHTASGIDKTPYHNNRNKKMSTSHTKIHSLFLFSAEKEETWKSYLTLVLVMSKAQSGQITLKCSTNNKSHHAFWHLLKNLFPCLLHWFFLN